MERTMARTVLSSIDEFMGLISQEMSHLGTVIDNRYCKELLDAMKSFLRVGDGDGDGWDFYKWKILQQLTYKAEAAIVNFILAAAPRNLGGRRKPLVKRYAAGCKKLRAHLKIQKLSNQIAKLIKRKDAQLLEKAQKEVLDKMHSLLWKLKIMHHDLISHRQSQPHWNWIRSSFGFNEAVSLSPKKEDEALSHVIGLSCEVDSLKKLLGSGEASQWHPEISNLGCRGKLPRVISILGIQGIGKTKLAREIYNKIGNEGSGFQQNAWVCASAMEDDFNKIWEDVFEQIKEPLLSDRRLIVIDDLGDPQFCEKLQQSIPTDEAVGWWIMITTRDAEVAAWAQHSMRLKVLNEIESWELFKSKLCIAPWHLGKENLEEEEQFNDYSSVPLPMPSELEALGKEMVGKCGGIPLLIMDLADLLSTKRANRVEWLCVLHGTDTHIGHRWFKLSSYLDDILPSHVKQFLHLFPRGTKIPSRRLMLSWCVQSSWLQSNTNPEFHLDDEIAMKSWLQELEFLNFIRAAQVSSVGIIKRYCIPDLPLLQILIKVAADNYDDDDDDDDGKAADPFQILNVVGNDDEYAREFRWIHRIADNYNSSGLHFRQIHDQLTSSASKPYRTLSSFWCFDYPGGDKPGKDVGNFLGKCINDKRLRLLRVLDLEGVYRPRLPMAIGELFNLRYFGLRWTYLDKLPPSVADLQNLQTLDTKHTEICYYPKIQYMERMQHLYLNERHSSELVKQLPYLTALRTLSGVIVDASSPVKSLFHLTNLRKLRLTCRFTLQQQYQEEAIAKWIGKLSFLQTLKLTSKDERHHDHQDDAPTTLSFLLAKSNDDSCDKQLSRVYLQGKLERLDNIVAGCLASNNLTALTLSFTNLTVDPMPKLGELPNLILLRLFAKSFVGNKMCCSAGTFKKLQVLKIWKLPILEDWTVESEAMPLLEELEIRSCDKLQNIKPHVPKTCRVLKLTNMPKELTSDITKKYHGQNVLPMSSIIIEKWLDSAEISVELYTGQASSFFQLGQSLEELLDLETLKSNLVQLTLYGTRLKQDQMSELEKLLSKLRELILSSNSFTGYHMTFSKGGFSELQKLTLESLDELEKLTVNDGAMPKLEELKIKSCNKNLKCDLPRAVRQIVLELEHLKIDVENE